MKQFLLRLQALVLATIFVAGSFGLPEADVLLDHGLERGPARTQVHLEGRGGCSDHSDHCVLGRLLADLRDLAPGQDCGSTLVPSVQSSAHRTSDRFVPQHTTLSYCSRAPPSLA